MADAGAWRGRGEDVPQRDAGEIEYVPGEPGFTDYPSEEHGCAKVTGGNGASLEPGSDEGSCRVPTGTLFIVGDNRGNSHDSRYRGAFPVSSVRARVVGVWLSTHGGRFARVGTID